MAIDAGLEPYRVLIVDDVMAERTAIRAAVEAAVPNCRFVEENALASGERALKERPEPFDLAVVDVRLLNDQEGLRLLGRSGPIRDRYLQTRIIVVTAYPDVGSCCEAFENGADAYISKMDLDWTKKLQEKAKELLGQRQFREDLRKQFEAYREAEKAFATNREEWTRRYGGKFLAVGDGKVIVARENPHDLGQVLDRLTQEERLRVAILRVPLGEEPHGDN